MTEPVQPSAGHNPGDLQLAILEVLWERGESTVADVHAALLPTRGVRPTTVSTTLSKMDKRGLVRYRVDGRTYVYEATVQRGELRRSMVTDVVDRAFSGKTADMVSMMLREGDFDPDELLELRAQLAERLAEELGDGPKER